MAKEREGKLPVLIKKALNSAIKKVEKQHSLLHDLGQIIAIFVACWILAVATGIPLPYIVVGGAIIIGFLVLPKIRYFTPYVYSLLSWTFGVISIFTLVNYTIKITPPYVVGEDLVLVEVDILPGFYMKPITILMFSMFLWFAFGLHSPVWKRRFLEMLPEVRRVLYVFFWLLAVGSGYEIIYHIVIWSAALSVQGLVNPDIIINPWPQNRYPINVVFASKIIVLIFAAACFMIDYLRRIEREIEREKQAKDLEELKRVLHQLRELRKEQQKSKNK